MPPSSQKSGYHEPPSAIFEKGQDVLYQSIPSLKEHETNKTTSQALHSIKFQGGLGHWETFQAEVRSFCDTQCRQMPNKILSCRLSSPSPSPLLQNEQVLCGDETSVSGRFTQNVLHPVTAVSRLTDIAIQFGDFKICEESRKTERIFARTDMSEGRKIPDYVATNPKDSKLRFVGEAKTPWKHNLMKFVKSYREENNRTSLEKAFGQVADYMYFFDVKYGFITTYDQTIFLKQFKVGNSWGLYYSSPILREAGGKPGQAWDPKTRYSPESVSIRQCMLWLCSVTQGDDTNYTAGNDTPVSKWVSETDSLGSRLVSPYRVTQYHLPHNPPISGSKTMNQYQTGGPTIIGEGVYLTSSINPMVTPPRQTGQAGYTLPIRGPPRESPEPTSHYGTPSRLPSREPSPAPPGHRPREPGSLQGSQSSRLASRESSLAPPGHRTREPRGLQAPRDPSPPESIELALAGSSGELAYNLNGQGGIVKMADLTYVDDVAYIKIDGRMYRAKVPNLRQLSDRRGESRRREPPRRDESRGPRPDKKDDRKGHGFFSKK